MHLTSHDIGVAQHIGQYSDGIEVAAPHLSWLVLSGTPGLSPDGSLPDGFAAQATAAWENVARALAEADFRLSDLVKVSTSLVDAADIEAYTDIRRAALGEHRPAFMLSVVSGMVRPDILIEVEVWAAKSVHPSTGARLGD